MKLQEAISILKIHQQWRLGADIVMIEPKELTQAIDTLLNYHIVDINEMVEDTFKVWECCGMENYICKGSDEPNNITYWVGVVKWNDGRTLTTEPFYQYQDIKLWSSKFSYENTGKFESIDYKRIDGKSYTYSEALKNEELINNAKIIKDVASSQTEISDEEIEKEAINRSWQHNDSTLYEIAWEDAIEWYREQLKQRQ